VSLPEDLGHPSLRRGTLVVGGVPIRLNGLARAVYPALGRRSSPLVLLPHFLLVHGIGDAVVIHLLA
jgi:hypothetical protein